MAEVSNTQDWRVLKEKVEILNGDRGDGAKAALRVGEAKDLREFIANLRRGTADVQKDLAIAMTSLAALSENLSAVQLQLDDAEEQLTTTTEGLADAQDALDALEPTVAALGESLAAAEAAILALGDIAGEVDDLQTSVGTLITTVAGQGAAINDIKTDAAAVAVPAATASTVGAAPTAAEHNALLDDVAGLRTALTNLKAAIVS